MARHEHPREDLIAEATALARRVELRLPDVPSLVVFGFRRTGGASFYFGEEPVFQFNSRGELRRAFVAGRLLKAESGALSELTRRREADAVVLASRRLSADEQAAVLADARARLERARDQIQSREVAVTRQVPPELDLIAEFADWLGRVWRPGAVADAPNAG